MADDEAVRRETGRRGEVEMGRQERLVQTKPLLHVRYWVSLMLPSISFTGAAGDSPAERGSARSRFFILFVVEALARAARSRRAR